MTEEELAVRVILFFLVLWMFTLPHGLYIYGTSGKTMRRNRFGTYVPLAAGIHGRDAQRRRRNPYLQLHERPALESADARCDAAPPPAA